MSRATLLRGRVGRFLLDSYTRDRLSTTPDDPLTPGDDESTDDWGNPETTEGSAPGDPRNLTVPNVPCMFVDAGEPIMRSGSGTLILEVPVILVAHDDPILAGDQVRDIRSRQGQLRLPGPAIVEDVTVHGTPGYDILRMCKLRQATSV